MLFPESPTQGVRFADVIVPLALPQVLTYGVPTDMQALLRPGMRVEVSLGRNRQYAAIVDRLHNNKPELYQVKPIRNIIDDEPVVSALQLEFWRWISHYYIAAPGEVMQAALPAHLKLMGETRLIWKADTPELQWTEHTLLAVEALEHRTELSISELKALVGERHLNKVLDELIEAEAVLISDALEQSYAPRREKFVSLAPEFRDEQRLSKLFDTLARAPKQLELLMALIELTVKQQVVKQSELLDRSGCTAAQIAALQSRGILLVEEIDVDRVLIESSAEKKSYAFTEAQFKAYEAIEEGFTTKQVILLEGVTGSGKTLLYIHKIKACLAQGAQVLLLLPEIGLTTQLVSRLYQYFGEELGVYHSRFSNNERVEIWEKVKRGTYKVVAGPRSALWLPFQQLGMIIVDEEHDASYKQKDPAPRFHARDAAIYLAGLHGAQVLLGSATPSVESLHNVQTGKYGWVPLRERYLGVDLPEIQVINAKSLEAMRSLAVKLITPELYQAMAEALSNKKQIILFQNRRGYAPFQLCMVCGWVPQCKNCAVALTYHKTSDKLHCHYCGLKSAIIHTCPSCGSNRLQSKTYGTEKVEEEVQQLFPEARIARMDVDSMRGKQTMNHLFEKLEKHKIDILVGTQMVVKGLDFARVALVGILSADSLLSYPDFRVNERAFQLMEQVSGRAGRTDGAGKVFIQAHNTKHPVIAWVIEHNVRAFYDHEIRFREYFSYPPFTRLIKIIFKHKDEAKAVQAATMLCEALKLQEQITLQGPVPALVSRVRNLYIQEVSVKCPRDTKIIAAVKSTLIQQRQFITAQRGLSSLQMLFDVDPY